MWGQGCGKGWLLGYLPGPSGSGGAPLWAVLPGREQGLVFDPGGVVDPAQGVTFLSPWRTRGRGAPGSDLGIAGGRKECKQLSAARFKVRKYSFC